MWLIEPPGLGWHARQRCRGRDDLASTDRTLRNLTRALTQFLLTVDVTYAQRVTDDNLRTLEALRRAVDRAAVIADELELHSRRAADVTQDEWLIALGRLGASLAELRRAVNDVSPALGLPSSAHDRILRYLRLRVGKVVTKDELEGVAGISEWARRVRELREDGGWQISTNSHRPDLRAGEYVLESPTADPELAARWRTARAIQRSRRPATDRVLDYLRSNVGRTVQPDEIAYVGGVADASGVVQELVDAGWQIVSAEGDAGQGGGGYRLTSDALPPD
jgi:hypothetical protein